MRARVLGHLSLEHELGRIGLPSGRVRRLLELLLLRPNETHAVGFLIERLWPDAPPDPALVRRLHTTVSRLRGLLGGHKEPTGSSLAIITEPGGYRLHATAATLDRLAFEEAAEAALAARRVGPIDDALALLTAEPYTGFPLDPEVHAQRTRLLELQRQLLDARAQVTDRGKLGDRLALAKVRPPYARSLPSVPRERLLAGMPAIGEVAVLSTVAPAGYGKSALLAQWAQRQSAPVAWVSLDIDDNDPARVWSTVLRSIRHAGPIPVDAINQELAVGSHRFLEALFDVIAGAGGRLAVVFDDTDRVTNEDLHAHLLECIELLPAGCTVALASRSPLPSPIGRLQGEGRAYTLGVDDLAFDESEVAALLALHDEAASDEAAHDGRAARLHRRTGGWPVAVSLLVRSGIDEDRLPRPTEALTRYLVDDVLAAMPDAVVSFVLATAHLRALNSALCDAVTGRTDGSVQLAWLRRHGLFLVDGDEADWLRYHDLIATRLQAHVRDRGDVDVKELDRRAARWHLAHGLHEEALEYAVRCRDRCVITETAGEVLASAALRGEARTCRSWLARLDPSDLLANPHAHAIAVYLAVLWLDEVDRIPWVRSRHRHFGADDVILTFVSAVESMREGQSTLAVELSEQVMKQAWEGVDATPDLVRVLAGSALTNLVMARLLQDTLRHDDALFTNAVSLVRPAAPNIAAWIHSYWALAALVDGEEELARGLAEEFHTGLVMPDELPVATRELSPVAALLASARASSASQQRRLVEPVEVTISLREQLGMHTEVAIARLVAACLYRRAGAFAEAAEHERRADVLLRTFEDAPFLHRLRDHLINVTFQRPGQGQHPRSLDVLTDRQRTVLSLLRSPRSIQDIANELHVSTSTVRSHVAAIYRKLGVTSRHEAVLRAGLLDP